MAHGRSATPILRLPRRRVNALRGLAPPPGGRRFRRGNPVARSTPPDDFRSTMPAGRKLRYGMVGGGPGAFIGAVHRRAASMDGMAELLAGVFSSRPEGSQQTGRELFLDPR